MTIFEAMEPDTSTPQYTHGSSESSLFSERVQFQIWKQQWNIEIFSDPCGIKSRACNIFMFPC